MKKDKLKDDTLTRLMQETCPEPRHDADFTNRVVRRIVKDRQQKEQALQYWHEQVGMPLPKTWRWRLFNWIMSPMLALLVVVAAVFAYRHEIFVLLRQCWEGQNYIIGNGITLPMPIVMSVACGATVLGVLGCTIAILNSED